MVVEIMYSYKDLFTSREVNYSSPYYWVKHLMELIAGIPFFGPGIFYLLFIPIYMGISFVLAVTIFPDGDLIVFISGFIIMIILYFLAGKIEKLYEYREDKFRAKIFEDYEEEIKVYNRFLSVYENDSHVFDDPKEYIHKVFTKIELSNYDNLTKKLKRLHFNTHRIRENKVNASHLDILFRNL